MTIENTETFLIKFGYNFTRDNNELMVQMPLSQYISLDFAQDEAIHISNKLNSWNYLTGFIKMELKHAFIFNLILGVVISYGISFYDTKLGLGIFIASSIWSIIWTLTYKERSDRFKQFLLKWSQQYSKVTV
ncbi:hypothetical protein [Aestuariibaculum suncheonense]|uniref:Uncharacterized protein n=1 Tax=Aestuariibaculum suncheonense TaxID=1028745 RepID=A0A8J6QVP8_9FLAO|nr:hypothetical protein [Aestuariibaculum suncheonense]MBD0835899.1 hypothetical protein [Aestuariibaculum suncheonense]